MTTKTRRTKQTEMTRDSVVEYENMMRDSAESEKSGDPLQWAINDDSGMSGVWDSEFKAFVDTNTLKHLFFSEDWVYILVDLVALKISRQQLRVMTSEVVDGQLVKKPMEQHPIQALIENPNPYQSYNSWMYCSMVDLCLLGNAIQWYAPSSNTIVVVPAETITLDISDAGKVEAYKVSEYGQDGGALSVRGVTTFPAEEIAHLRKPNPSSMLWGLSPFIPGRKSVLFNRYSTDYLNSFYQKGAMPGFALEMDKEANERVAMRLLRSFENAYTGRRNMRRTLVLPKGVSLKEVSHSLANQELSTYIAMNREVIMNILKVPKHELSLAEAGSLGSEEAKMALSNFWASTLLPMMSICESELTKFFIKRGMLTTDQFLEFDISNIDALQENLETKAGLSERMLKTHTLNEVRKMMYNLPPIEGGDVVAGFNQQASPFGMFGLSDKPQQMLAAPEEQVVQQALPSMQDIQGRADETLSDKPSKIKADKDKLATFLKGNDQWFARRESMAKEEIAKGISEMERRALKLFGDMAAEIVRIAKNYLKEKSYGVEVSKAVEAGNAPQSKLVKRAELRRRIRKALDGFEEQYISDTRNALMARVEAGYDVALQLPFNMPSVNEIEGLRARNDMLRTDALEERAGRAFRYLNETTLGKVFTVIENGIDQGKTVQDIASGLRETFSDIKEIGARAMTIARTETLTAVSIGQAAAMKDAAEVIPNLKKMWITADDDRVRDAHVTLHGDVADWDDAFDNNLQFPRDPNGPAEEVINCRCTWIMVPEEQMSQISDNLAANEVEE